MLHPSLNIDGLCSTCVRLSLIGVVDMIGVLSFVCPVVSLFPYVVLAAVRALDDMYDSTLCRFVCFVFWVHQQGGGDWFEVLRYVIRLEHPCQLSRQLTNVGRPTLRDFVIFSLSRVDILLISSCKVLTIQGLQPFVFMTFLMTSSVLSLS